MRIFKEPLFHFIVIGAVFFGLYNVMNRKNEVEHVVVSTQTIQNLIADFSKDWNREPSSEEVEVMIDDYVRDELAYREGLELGLDQNDPVIRQRIRQKLEFMAEEQATQLRPSDQELELFLQNNRVLFEEEGVVPGLAQIRNMVLFEWENEQRLKFLEQQYAELHEKYGVQIAGEAE
jgi:hypothetical protein